MASLQKVSSEELRAELARRAARDAAAVAAERRMHQPPPAPAPPPVMKDQAEEIPPLKVPRFGKKGVEMEAPSEASTRVPSSLASSSQSDRSTLTTKQVVEEFLRKKSATDSESDQEGKRALVEEEAGKDSDEELAGVTEGSSRRSSARPRAQKGAANKEKNLLRMQRHVERNGGTWSLTRQQHHTRAVEMATNVKGSIAYSVQHAVVAKANEEYRPLALLEMLEADAYTPPSLASKFTDLELAASQRFLVFNPCANGFACNLCRKMADESHLGSATHKKAVAEMLVGDGLAGIPQLPGRRFGFPNGLTEPLTQQSFAAVWGDNIKCLNTVVMMLMGPGSGGFNGVKFDKSLLRRSDIAGFHFAVCSYGHRKYDPAIDYMIDWVDVPETVDHAFYKKHELPEGRGWWPVVWFEVKPPTTTPKPKDPKTKSPEQDPFPPAICFYQIMWDEPTAWRCRRFNDGPLAPPLAVGVWEEPIEV